MRRDPREQNCPSVDQGCSIKKFIRLNPSTFAGGPNPVAIENWVQEIEVIMEVLGYIDEQKVKLLEGQRLVKVALTWERFEELFFDRYFPSSTREEKVEVFTNLTQGNITVGEYAVKFVELSHFAPFMIPNEARKARIFEKGLRRKIYELVVGFQVQNFSDLVYKALVLEKSLRGSTESSEQRKRHAPPNFQAEANQGSWKREMVVGPR
ncbi:uncharacterized protein LOC131148373 [Malania oleifera]|uniref:uncharacterized protein LOC131148373 n=1 Tax=Malania oleifera TaxID=397392 RepID=UPI0025AE9B71|nr:uncharacterized protein LOC131148373 [Malania oleifera]